MSMEGVFATGVSGMGPALTERGERIVNEKREARDRLLDDLERRGLNVDALAHRHRSGECECGQSRGAPSAQARIAHLEHRVAVQENQIILLREALQAARGESAAQEK